jgi:small subunit ribosomal protein S13
MLKNYKFSLKRVISNKKFKFINRHFYLSRRFIDITRSVYGINYYMSYKTSIMLGCSFNLKSYAIRDIYKNYVSDFFLSYFLVERGLKKLKDNTLTTYKEIGSYNGYRIFKGLPVNGQRTHTNSKTVRRMFRLEI